LRDIVSKLDDPVGAGWRDVLAVAGESHRRPPGSILLRPDVDPAGADPGNRTWLVVRGSEPVGSVQVTVRAGVGSVRAEVREEDRDQVSALLHHALGGDRQVRELKGWKPG